VQWPILVVITQPGQEVVIALLATMQFLVGLVPPRLSPIINGVLEFAAAWYVSQWDANGMYHYFRPTLYMVAQW
jgi:hypothetical protein